MQQVGRAVPDNITAKRRGREPPVILLITEHGLAHLTQVPRANRAPGFLAGTAEDRPQHRRQPGDDPHDDQQFDKRKTRPP